MPRLPRLRGRWLALLLLGLASMGCERMLTRPLLYATVTVEVQRRNGEPIPGARLTLYTGQRPMGYGVSDSAGRYVFEEVPEGVYGVLAFPPPGYERPEVLYPTEAPSEVVDRLTVTAGQPVSARFEFLKRGFGTVEATVREPDGTPVRGLLAVLYDPAGEFRRGNTDSTGRITFDFVPFGSYGVLVERPELYRDSGEVAYPTRDGMIIEAGATQRADFTFERCLGSITAQVIDQDTRPVPNAELVFYSGPTVLSRLTLPANGERQYGPLRCDEYGFRVLLPRGYTATERRGSAFLDGVRIRRNAQPRATLTVRRLPRATVAVRIRDDVDAPVSNARVVLYNSAGVIRDVRTGADGTVAMDTVLMNEPHGVRVVNPRGYRLGEGFGISYVDQLLLADGERRELPFRMARTGRASVQVRVVDQDDRPVAATRVVLYTGAGVERNERTAADGTLTFGDIITGADAGNPEYGVRVVPPSGYSVAEGRGLTFEDGLRLGNGELRRLTFRFLRTAP